MTSPNDHLHRTALTHTSTAIQPSRQPNSPNRLPIIGRSSIVLLLLLIIGAATGCGLSGDRLPGPGSALELVPVDTEGVFRLDLPAIADNPDLQENAHEFTVGSLVNLDLEGEEASFGTIEVDLTQAEEILHLISDTDIGLLRGDLQFDDLREDLEDANYEETTYRGYEAWASPHLNFALLEDDGFLVYSSTMSAVEGVLKDLYRGEGSLAAEEDAELERILGKMGDAPAVMAMAGDHCPDRRCQGFGVAFTGTDSQAENLTADIVVLYSSDRAAEQAADDYDNIASFLEMIFGLDVADTKSDGDFVVGEATYDISR